MPARLTFDDLWRIPQVHDPQRSPNGESVAYVLHHADRDTDGYVARIWLVDVSTGRARPLTNGPADRSPRWSPDGRSLAFVSTRAGDGHAQVWLLPAGGAEPRRLTAQQLGVCSEPVWSPDGRSIAFLGVTAARSSGDDPVRPQVFDDVPFKVHDVGYTPPGYAIHLYVVAVEGGEPRQLTTDQRFPRSPAWSPDGESIAFSAQLSTFAPEPVAQVFVVAATGGSPRRVSDDDRLHSFVGWTPDGRSLLTIASNQGTLGLNRLHTLPATGGVPRELVPDFDLVTTLGRQIWPGAAQPTFAPDGRLLFLACDRSCQHLLAVDARGGAPRKVIGGEDRVVSGLSVTPAGIAFVLRTPDSSGEIHVAAPDGSGERRLTSHFAEALPDVELFRAESRTFVASDGTKLHGWFLRGGPDGSPLLLDIHGGPHACWSPAFEGVELYHQVLAANGWNVLLPNMRGSDGYGASFWLDLMGRWGIADEGDFHAALDTLIAEGVADPAKLALGGYSYGGFMTCWLTARSDRFVAAVAGGLVCNMVGVAGTSDYGAPMVAAAVDADPWCEHIERLMERSPLTRVANVVTPTLVLQGGAELRTTVDQAEQWFAGLRARGTRARFVVYPGAGHEFIDTGPPSFRLDYYRRYADWVHSHTAGAPLVA